MLPHPTLRLATALAHSDNYAACDLLSRMNRCGGSDWNHQFFCRTAGCSECRGRYIAKQVRAAKARYDALSNADLSFVSIVIGTTTCVDDVGDIFTKFRKDMRNLVDANRRARRRWNELDALLWLETDALSGADYSYLGSDKQAQLGELAPMFVLREGPVWVVTTHGLIAHPSIDYQEVRAEFERRWPGTKRVDVRPFYSHKPKAQNIKHTVNYSLKHECRTHLGARTESWPSHWMADYYCFLNIWSRGFQSTRITISPKKYKVTLPDQEDTFDSEEEDAMPFTYSNSIFDTYYN